jgi:hypothetical protein
MKFMKPLLLPILALAALLTNAQAGQSAAANAADSSRTTSASPRLLPETILQLESVRQAAARFFDIQKALDEGYVDIDVDIPHMGRHLLKPRILDAHFELTQPELLVYQQELDGALRLVAVEYAIPVELSARAPRGFVGNDDVWFNDPDFKLWTLHAWVYDFNPAGVFSPENPRLP